MTSFDIHDVSMKGPFSEIRKPVAVGIAFVLVMVVVFAGRAIIDTATANEFSVTSKDETVKQDDGQVEAKHLFVHITGAVVNPGLYELPDGSRVADAVQAAGGFSEGALTSSVNLARVLSDGEQLVVLSEDEAHVQQSTSTGQGDAATQASAQTGLVNINTANAAELETLPGIGAATAEKVIADRVANGSFKTIEDLKRVSGIGDKKFEALSGLICV